MPYNNTPIAPPEKWSGSISLPLARVKKIINADDDIGACSNNAAFMIAVATEMFVQYAVEMTHNVVKAERRPRRNIQYRDVSNAIARVDNLEFLTDVVPRTITYKQYKEKKAKEDAAKANDPTTNGQNTLDGWSKGTEGDEEMVDADEHPTTMPNGYSHGPKSPVTSLKPEFGSPGAPRAAVHFDAVRNGFEARPGSSGALEE